MKKLKLLLPLILIILMAAGCDQSDADSAFIDVQDYSEEPEGKEIKIVNDQFEFTFNADNTQFSVLNKADGHVWYSNPQDIENDTLALGSNKDILYSTLYVKYSDSKGQDFSYDNFASSIREKRYSVEEIKDESGKVNGVKVLYTIGDIQKSYVVPYAITEERMDKFCANMSDADSKRIKNFYRRVDIENLRPTDNKDELLEMYPDLADTKMYIIRDGQSDTKFEEFQELFSEAGYTKEEYDYDMSRSNITHETDKAAFNIPVYYTLEDNGLVVDVPMEEIQYYKDYPITYLTVLPFFAAGGVNEKGYMFVPEGSGGIINFNNGKTGQAAYYNQLYGADLCLTRKAVVDESEVSYPVIGVANGGSSVLCTIENGSSYAIVESDVAGRYNSYNSVKFTYTMLRGEDMDISGKSDITIRTYEKGLPAEHLTQRYMFVNSDNYVDMAAAYRDYLMKTYPSLNDKTDENVSLVLDMVGGVDDKQHILGVPVTKDLPLTKYEDAETILNDMIGNGIDNLTVKYSGWCNNGIHNSSVRKVKPSKKLGSKKELKSFIQTAQSNDVDVYFDANFQLVYKNKIFDKYGVNRDTAKFVSRETAELSYYSPIYFAQQPEEYEYYLGRPAYAIGNVDSFHNYITGLGCSNISFADLSTELSGDYNYKKHVSREEAMNMITAKYQELSESGSKVMANSDYFYNIPYADVVTGMVLSNKNFNIVDEAIPFYQIALHGIVNYTAESLNLSQNSEETYLKSAELGAGLYYTITQSPSSVLQDSKYTEYFATEYNLWKDTINEDYNRFSNDFNGTYDEYITGHEKIAENVYKTEFANGVKVIVNYNYNPFNYNGTEIQARDYIVEGGNN